MKAINLYNTDGSILPIIDTRLESIYKSRLVCKYGIFDGSRYKSDGTVAGDADTGYVYTGHFLDEATGNSDTLRKCQFRVWNHDGKKLLDANEKVEIVPCLTFQDNLSGWLNTDTYGDKYMALRLLSGATSTIVRVAKFDSTFSSGTYNGHYADGISSTTVAWTIEGSAITTQLITSNAYVLIYQHAGTGVWYTPNIYATTTPKVRGVKIASGSGSSYPGNFLDDNSSVTVTVSGYSGTETLFVANQIVIATLNGSTWTVQWHPSTWN